MKFINFFGFSICLWGILPTYGIGGNDFRHEIKCYIGGNKEADPKMIIYQDNRFGIKTFDSSFMNVKIKGVKESHEFRIQHCSCYVHDGNCRVSFISEEKGKYLKLITLFEYDKPKPEEDLRGKTFKDVFQALEKSNNIKDRSYCNVNSNLYISSIHNFISNGNLSPGYFPSYSSSKSMIESDHRFPLYYQAEAAYGNKMDEKNGQENVLAAIGSFRMESIVECISKDSTFQENKLILHNVYKRKGARTTETDCAWGSPAVDRTSNTGLISNNGRCGSAFGKCPNNQCCNQFGYCGNDEKFCGAGCQANYGICN